MMNETGKGNTMTKTEEKTVVLADGFSYKVTQTTHTEKGWVHYRVTRLKKSGEPSKQKVAFHVWHEAVDATGWDIDAGVPKSIFN